jgi:hypothetical protein
VKNSARFAFFCFFLVLLSLHAQTVVFTGTYVNFGNVNLCAPGHTTPAPCSETLTLNYKVTAAGTLGAPRVLTMGRPNLDFALASNSCTGRLAAGLTCNLQVTLTPRFPGLRSGAVQLTDAAGNLLATTFLRGIGVGPQVAINTPLTTTLAVSPNLNF